RSADRRWGRSSFVNLNCRTKTSSSIDAKLNVPCLAANKRLLLKFEVVPSDTEVNPGEDVALQCKVLNRRGDCVWLKDDHIIGSIPGKYNFELEPEDGDCSLQIVKASLEEDDASWKCQVTKATRKGSPITSSAIKLVVLEQPRPPHLEDGSNRLRPGDTLKTKVGDIRDIKCVSRKGNPPALLQWFLDSQDISHLAQQTNHTDEEKPRTWKAVSFLNYTFTEIPLQRPLSTSATVVALNCEAEGNPVPEIKWFKQSEKDPNVWAAQGQKGKLTLLHASYRDSGVYRCEATNTIWNQQHVNKSQQLRIDIRGPPEVKTLPASGHLEVKKGEPFEIGCVASGNPDPVLTWRHMNDSSIDVNALVERNVIRISSADHMHAGTYECTANNNYGEPAVRFISVKITGKPTVKTTAQWTRGLDGSRNAQLLCEVYGASPRSTIWLRSDGSPLVQGKTLHLTVDGNNHTARLNNVSNLDYDNYTCVSHNDYGFAMSTVEISGKPTVKTTMQWIRGLDGSRIAELVCIVHSANSFRTDWLHSDGTPLIEGKFVNLSASGNNLTATLYNASELDYGNYTCVSQNNHGIAMSTVEISGRPTLKTTLQWIRGLDGSRSAELVCEAHSPIPSRTKWLRSGGSPLVSGESVHLYVGSNNHTARFNNVSERDYGNYTCVSQNKYGIAMSTVEISGKPTVKATVHWRRGTDGSRGAELVCTTHSAIPSRTDWLRSDLSPLVYGESVHLSVAGNNHTAKFIKITERDYGNYTCVCPKQIRYSHEHRRDFSRLVPGIPAVTTTVHWTRGVNGSIGAELVCVVQGATPSTTRWMRDDGTWLLQDESVYLSTVGNNYMATFKNISGRDYGNYTCVSHNKYGMAMDTVQLSGKPKVTTILQWTSHLNGSISAKLVCTSYSSNSSNTRWIRDDGSPLLDGDIVQLSSSDSSYTVTFKDVGEEHYGNYTCVSHSESGISMETVVLSGES
ncbi:hypothetical protein HPB47_026032, partial [Ixodes persulcatus]